MRSAMIGAGTISHGPWYEGPVPPSTEIIPDYAPAGYVLPDHIIGENPYDTFNLLALPRLREAFPAWYEAQRRRAEAAGEKAEVTPEYAFMSEALMLRIMIDSADRAAQEPGDTLMTLDMDKTTSRKADEFADRSFIHIHDEADEVWDSGSVAEDSLFHKSMLADLEATVTRLAVIVGVDVLKQKYGDRIHFGIVSSNRQDYLDRYIERLNRETMDAFEANYVVSYVDGRYARSMKKKEIEMARADWRRQQIVPTLRELLAPHLSPAYHNAARYIDLDHPDAQTVSAQDLKLAILLRLQNEDPYRNLNVVHLDDMPSPMHAHAPGLQYVQLPEAAWFCLIENEIF